MMGRLFSLRSNSRGSAAIEFAFAVPVLMMMIWGIFQIGLVYQAKAGMQHALGEAGRYATLYPTPTDTAIQSKITARKFGVGNGTWDTPSISTDSTAHTKTISVTYHQPMNFLFFNGPNVNITRSKTVHLSY